MAIRIESSCLTKFQSLTFEYSESQFKNFRTDDGKVFAKTYKSCKRKIAQLFGIDMTNASHHSCKLMESLQSAKLDSLCCKNSTVKPPKPKRSPLRPRRKRSPVPPVYA
jgi:hypothetical protein